MGTYPCTVGEIAPGVDDPVTFGDIICKRVQASQGTAVTSANIFLSSGWDTDATFTVDQFSDSARGIVRVTAGTAPSANAFWTLTYPDIWSSQPFAMVMREGANQPMVSTTVGVLTVTQTGAIANLTQIIYHYSVM